MDDPEREETSSGGVRTKVSIHHNWLDVLRSGSAWL